MRILVVPIVLAVGALAAGCSGSAEATPPPSPPPAGEPAPIAGQGYGMVMDEEFNSLTPEWGALWWQPTSPPNSTYVQDGVLNLVSRRSQG